MKHQLYVTLLTLEISLFTVSFAFAQQASVADSIVRVRFHSEILEQDRGLIIHLPRNYDPGRKYPVMYVLDGSSQDQHIADEFDSLSLLGLVPQTIIVGIPNMTAANRTFQLVPPFMLTDPNNPDSPVGTADTFLSFMESELIPFIAEKYGASELRSFAGNSRGGLLVLYSLILKPDLFAGRFCFSTPLWRQDNLLVSRASEFLSSKQQFNSFIYLSVGANETENIRGGLEAMKQSLQQNTPNGLTWYAAITPHVDHQQNAKASARDAIQKWGEYVKNLK
ncbi:MAG: alpha/beta hydrolase [Cyclobacteriaceae bacterium]|nr:alpha/beta hydrolase [Cyclobacteriaceae bacterium]